MIWLAVGALTLAVALVLLQPLWRARRRIAVDTPELALYRDQLAEIERDAALGTLTPEQADAARLEVQRRLLAAAGPLVPAPQPSPAGGRGLGRARGRWALAVPLLAIVVAGSLALYLELGAPDAARVLDHTETADAREFARLVEQLRAKLKDNPRDVDGWLLLARSLRALDRLPEAAEAYLRALALSGGKPEVAAAYGELLIEIAQGTVTREALDLFHQALAREPGEPRARFYVGLAKAQGGDAKGAIEDWRALLRDAPPDAPYAATVRGQIADAAKSAGIAAPEIAAAAAPMTSPVPPRSLGSAASPPGPSAADVAAAANMSSEDRQKMIRGMVDGLAARLKDQPDDIDGWLRLGRAYTVLDEPERARAALGEATQRAPQRVDVLAAYAQAIYTPARAADKPPPEFVAVMRKILALDPANAQALWFVGNDAAAAGDRQQAATLFKRLLERLPPNAPLRPQVQQRLDAVQGG
jgi:cytochrome c-type biogenesis protein CcmH